MGDIMNEENNIVRFETDEGEVFDMIVIKEFEYKDKKYAVLIEDSICDNNCDCGCKEDKECNCNHNEICILEISKDKDNNDIFITIDDEKLYNEVIEEADKILYED